VLCRTRVRWHLSLLAATCFAGCAIPIIGAFPHDERAAEADPQPAAMSESWSKAIGPIPNAAETQPAACYTALQHRGVRFERLPRFGLNGIKMPIRLLGKLGGIDVVPSYSDKHSLLDCRLALALLSWAPSMRKAGVVSLEHLSIYRPGAHIRGGPRISGHAYALAIDAARFHMRDGRVLDVLHDWEDRDRGDAPCLVRSRESSDARLIRRVVCAAVAHNLFQVVLTPHYDNAHRNHVHLELKPDVDWTFVR
jgi:hypothetical protein